MIAVVAVADHHFARGATRLAASLANAQPDAILTLYCDDPAAFGGLLAAGNVELRPLPAIATYGAKRAKFAAFADATQRGGFLYLDCDVVVLESLAELCEGEAITAAPDDLLECPFISDRQHPWPGDPHLENTLYINSGVVYFPASASSFLKQLEQLARDEETWSRYILPGRLYDNHFLCAHLNLLRMPVRLVSATRYNWQGFRSGSRVLVERHGKQLRTGIGLTETLALIHFAGLTDSDAFLRAIAPSISSRIYAAGIDKRLPPDTDEAQILAAADAAFDQPASERGTDLLATVLSEATLKLAAKTSPHERLIAPRHRIEVQLPQNSPAWEQEFVIPVTIHNLSDGRWPCQGPHPVVLSYHWLNASHEIVNFDGLRTALPRDLSPGENLSVLLQVKAPPAVGLHHLQVDLLQEGHLWFASSHPAGAAEVAIAILPPLPSLPSSRDISARNDLIAWEEAHLFFTDLRPEDVEIIRSVRPYTMTTPARLAALLAAVDHVVKNRIPGDFVECGVWKGGSAMAIAQRLLQHGVTDRQLVLCDTFEGMPKPAEIDRNIWGESAPEKFTALRTSDHGSMWAHASLPEVQANLKSTGFPDQRIRYIVGRVEQTLPASAPTQIALLRLDTDWYASTLHELQHLTPRMPKGAIVIVDDYGHWQGARQAVEEFFISQGRRPFLHRLDDAARLWVID